MKYGAAVIKKHDVLLFAAVLLLAGLSLAATALFNPGKTGVPSEAVITASGKTAAKLPLDADTEFEVLTEYGYNIVSVADGQVSITNADCAGMLCVRQGAISHDGQTVVCMPHGVLVEIRGKPVSGSSSGLDIDAVSK